MEYWGLQWQMLVWVKLGQAIESCPASDGQQGRKILSMWILLAAMQKLL